MAGCYLFVGLSRNVGCPDIKDVPLSYMWCAFSQRHIDTESVNTQGYWWYWSRDYLRHHDPPVYAGHPVQLFAFATGGLPIMLRTA